MRTLSLLLLVLAVVALGLPGCRRAPNADAGPLTFFFTSHTHGRLTHCGCFDGQFGGMARLRTAIRATMPKDAIGVDTGDAIEGAEDYHLLKYKQVLRGYGLMGYAALNAGHREATLPAKTLREITRDAEVPVISANLLDAGTDKPLLKPWTIITRGPLRIALVGVLDDTGLGDDLGEGLKIEPIETCLSRILPDVKQSADVLVLLAFTDEDRLNALARQFYEFSVILGGRVRQPAQQLFRVNQSVIYYTANEGKSFGALRMIPEATGKLRAGAHEMTLLDGRFIEDEGILQLVAEYRKMVRAAKLNVDDPEHASAHSVGGVRNAPQYAGTDACMGCHASAATVWKNSRHSHAFDSLVHAKADADPSCVGCHTVGFGTMSGYKRAYGTERLTHVGCESCHGPGSLHVAQRSAGEAITFHFRPLAAGDCMKCHHGEFSRPFEWDQFWPMVKHGKEPTQAAKAAASR